MSDSSRSCHIQLNLLISKHSLGNPFPSAEHPFPSTRNPFPFVGHSFTSAAIAPARDYFPAEENSFARDSFSTTPQRNQDPSPTISPQRVPTVGHFSSENSLLENSLSTPYRNTYPHYPLKTTEPLGSVRTRPSRVMYELDGSDPDMINGRDYMYGAYSKRSGGSGSSSSNDLFFYEEDEDSDSSTSYSYSSDQEGGSENHIGRVGRSRRRTKCPQQQIIQRQAANLRERRRMQSINDAFEGLRAHIPTLPYEKRLSKVDTLKLAIGYIQFLSDLVRHDKTSTNAEGTTKVSVSGKLHRQVPKEEPKKIIVRAYGSPYAAHSLSWSSNKENGCNGIMFAKVWTPESPTISKHSENLSNASNSSFSYDPNTRQ